MPVFYLSKFYHAVCSTYVQKSYSNLYNIKWFKTSWTYDMNKWEGENLAFYFLVK